MKTQSPPRFGAFVLAASAFVLVVSTDAADKPQPTDEQARKIASAVPGQAAVSPKQPRQLLVFTLCKGYYHTSIPHGALAVRLMGERTGAFTATVSDDIAMFEPAKLKEFDGICFVSALGELFLPDDFDSLPPEKQAELKRNDERLKQNLLGWLKSGKGLVGIHGASWLFYKWPEFSEALGGLFESHPWNAHEKIAVKLNEPEHPLVRVFDGRGFEIIDEGYQFKDPYSRNRNRVLYSMDLTRMETNKPNLRPDRDLGLCWVKRFGEGRVFYTALGHNEEEFWNPALLKHILDGIQFSLGDLQAPADPTGR
jgi:hypothetical protein